MRTDEKWIIDNNLMDHWNESFWKDTSTVDTIGDICEDLKDDGYEVKVEQNQSKRTYEYKGRVYIQGGFITITVHRYTLVPFSFDKVKETFTIFPNQYLSHHN